jgi:hypothetical protein
VPEQSVADLFEAEADSEGDDRLAFFLRAGAVSVARAAPGFFHDMKQARTARVNAARLRTFGEDVLVQVGNAVAVTVPGIRANRELADAGPGSFEAVDVDPDALPVNVADDGKSFVTFAGGEAMVVKTVSRPDPYGLVKLTLGKAR